MLNGIITIYKEAGYTSHDVVAKMRGICKQKKIGHTGTLDPQAIGVLPVCLGSGTGLCDMLTNQDKEYVAELLLGVETDTQDTTGMVLEEREVTVSPQEVREAIRGFVGTYGQVPPMYSALKVNGKKLYELARAGKSVERKPREVTIYEIEILEMSLPVVKMRVACSKGTYIRTLCADIGEKLGCGGTMKSLERTRVGQFSLDKAVTLSELEQIRDRGAFHEILFPVEHAFQDCPKLHMREDTQKRLENGNAILPEHTRENVVYEEGAWVRMARSDGSFAGVYAYNKDKQWYQPVKMFLERD